MSKNDFIVGLRILGIDTNIDENDDISIYGNIISMSILTDKVTDDNYDLIFKLIEKLETL